MGVWTAFTCPIHSWLGLLVHRRVRWILGVVLGIGLLVRLPFAPLDFHTTGDMETFRRWARTAQTRGLGEIYSDPTVNYPPVLLYLFAGAGWLADHLPGELRTGDRALNTLIKLPSMLADVVTAGLIAWTLRYRSPGTAVWAASVYVLNPAIWYVSSHWGQTDAVYTLFLVAAIIALERGALVPAWLAYILALSTKLQSVALAPLMLIVTWTRHGWQGLVRGVAAAMVVMAVLVSPWWLAGHLSDVIRAYVAQPPGGPRFSVSAYNLWYLLRLGHVHAVSASGHPAHLPLTYWELGIILFGTVAAVVVAKVVRSQGEPMALLSALLSLGLFLLLTQMRERYMFLVFASLALALAIRPSLWVVYAVLSVTFLFNLATIAPFTPALGTNLVAAAADSTRVILLKALSVLVAMVNVIVLVWLMAEQVRGEG